MEDFLYIGRVAGAHGVQGEIKVFPTTEDPKRFEMLDKVYLENTKGQTKDYRIISVKYHKKFILLGLQGVSDMDHALSLKQSIVKIPREQALPLDKNEFYVSDLIGLQVYDTQENRLGLLKDIIFTGSNDVYVVDNGTKDGLLLPAISECIQSIDLQNKKMIVYMMEGLMN